MRLFGVHREMHQRALGEHEDRLTRVAVVAILVNGIGRRLPTQGVLELERHHRDAVDRQHHIQRLFRLRAEVQLAGKPQPIGLKARFQLRVQAVGRAEECDPQGLAETLEAVTQRGQRAVGVQPLAQRFQHPRAGLLSVQCFQLLPHLALGGTDEVQRLVREDRPLAVEALTVDRRVPIRKQDRLDRSFKGGFASALHAAALACLFRSQ